MRVFYWNAQGLAKDDARAKLEELYLHNPDIICIAELQVFCTTQFFRKLKLVDFCEDVITNEAGEEKGNIWVLWRNSLARPDVLSSSKQAITLNFAGDITTVHASYDSVERKRLYRQLGLGFIFIPWLELGEFNCVLRLDENKGGRTIKEVYINEFRSWISENGLVEADAIGKKYTWSNFPSGIRRIFSKHDRAILKEALKIWNRTVFGDVQFHLKQAELNLETKNYLLDYDPTDEFQFLKVPDAKKVVDDVRTELAVMVKMKSRVTWLEDGDQKTGFYYNSIRMRRSRNTISELKVSTNTTLFLQEEINDYIC
ncbi:uncharacterized protein LOC113290758 [Papaver somniferum]|uniref:uncharacterized protein LOC113290758 n=1 Tax=Papaver somniferum TaxID=3469 RepID=UPI000E6FF056|nr:uncharacterized protein LOC113290758 [Papaver somniferum]